jgi:hypothetical protein
MLGLSSLGRTESHAFDAVEAVHRMVNVLIGSNGSLPAPASPAVEIGEGEKLLEANTNALLGGPPKVDSLQIHCMQLLRGVLFLPGQLPR